MNYGKSVTMSVVWRFSGLQIQILIVCELITVADADTDTDFNVLNEICKHFATNGLQNSVEKLQRYFPPIFIVSPQKVLLLSVQNGNNNRLQSGSKAIWLNIAKISFMPPHIKTWDDMTVVVSQPLHSPWRPSFWPVTRSPHWYAGVILTFQCDIAAILMICLIEMREELWNTLGVIASRQGTKFGWASLELDPWEDGRVPGIYVGRPVGLDMRTWDECLGQLRKNNPENP